MAQPERPNPFYRLLIVVGIAFVITAFAYGVVAIRALSPRMASSPAEQASEENGRNMTEFMNHYGLQLLGGEIALLAVATVGAIWLDSARQKNEANDRI